MLAVQDEEDLKLDLKPELVYDKEVLKFWCLQMQLVPQHVV